MATTPGLPDGLEIVGLRTPGLGDATYLVSYEGRGLIVDPQRDIDRFLDWMAEGDVDLRWVLETHLHNDYVSGGVVAAEKSGAELVLPAAAAPLYRHTPAFHHEDLGDDHLAIRPIHTPGHTPEHTSYLLIVEGEPVAVFSGGSLLVGSAGRPDLLGIERADSLARLQYQSVRRLAELPDRVGLYPTHGEGSFCTVSGAGQTTSTIAEEKVTNPVLAYDDVDSFVAGQLAILQPYPAYYRHMGPANLVGGSAIPGHEMPILSAESVADLLGEAEIVDIRQRNAYAAGHVPGSLGIELRDDFGVWTGWLVDIDTPIVLVADSDQDVAEARLQLARIGYDRLLGVMYGIESWLDAGRQVVSHEVRDRDRFAADIDSGAWTLDVRAPAEWETGHLSGSHHVYVPDLATHRFDDLGPGDKVWVVCGTGYRANIAAGILERKGLDPVLLAEGGVAELIQHQTADHEIAASR